MKAHQPGPTCPECEKKLLTAHPYLREWFRTQKAKRPDLHIAWAYRNQQEQEACVNAGSTRLHYPFSPHNATNTLDGAPESLALDVFQISEEGVAKWSWTTYSAINKENASAGEPITWGGKFEIVDGPHFQYNVKANV